MEKETKNKENSFVKIIWLIGTDCITFAFLLQTEDVAQLVRALVCGSKGRGFDPLHPPPEVFLKSCSAGLFLCLFRPAFF